jgi:hypothetical protein
MTINDNKLFYTGGISTTWKERLLRTVGALCYHNLKHKDFFI